MQKTSQGAMICCMSGLRASEAIDQCLIKLNRDNEHTLDKDVVDNLTYEELIGTLLRAQYELDCVDAALV